MLAVTNRGPSQARDVTVTDTLDRNLTFVSSDPSGCTASGRTVRCKIPVLDAGHTVRFTLRVKVKVNAEGATIPNVAKVWPAVTTLQYGKLALALALLAPGAWLCVVS